MDKIEFDNIIPVLFPFDQLKWVKIVRKSALLYNFP